MQLDMVCVLCAVHVMLSALLGSKEAVSTTCQAQRNPMFPDRSFNMEVQSWYVDEEMETGFKAGQGCCQFMVEKGFGKL